MRDAMDSIWNLRLKRGRIKALLDAYNTVREHIAPRLNPQAITLHMLDEQRAGLDDELEHVATEIAKVHAACSHAWEPINEARPPFQQCVRCGMTRAALEQVGKELGKP